MDYSLLQVLPSFSFLHLPNLFYSLLLLLMIYSIFRPTLLVD